MCSIDSQGVIHCISNDFLIRLHRLFTDRYDKLILLKLYLPLILLFGLFFVIKKYIKNKKYLIAYPFFAIIIYCAYIWYLSLGYFYQG